MGVAVGSFDVPTTTGNVSVTGLAFQPVAVMFWNVISVLSPPGMMFGCATADDEQWVIWTGADAEISNYNTRYNESRDEYCVYNRLAPFTSIAYAAEFVSLNSDGFTVNFTVRNATGDAVGYMAIGGDHVPRARAGTFTAGLNSGTTAVTAPGFTPNALIVAHGIAGSFDTTQYNHMAFGVGVATSVASQYAMGMVGLQGSSASGDPVSGYHIHRTDAIACSYDGTNTYRVELDSFDTNGFTVDVTDTWVNLAHGYLAIEADVAVSGNDIQPDSTGTQTISCPGLTPGGVFFWWSGVNIGSTTGGGPNVNVRPGVGAFTSTGSFASSLIFRAAVAAGVWSPDGYQETAGVIIRGAGDGINDPPAHDYAARGVFSSFAEDQFTINWNHATSGSDRPYGWLALPGEIPIRPQFYRVQPGGRIS